MTTVRLDSVAPELVRRLRACGPAVLRTVAGAASAWALEHAPVTDPRLGLAETARAEGRFGPSRERLALSGLVDELDNLAWDLQDAAEDGSATDEEYTAAFSQARAASALWSALAEDPIEAALEAVYEAQATVDDDSELRRLIGGIIGN